MALSHSKDGLSRCYAIERERKPLIAKQRGCRIVVRASPVGLLILSQITDVMPEKQTKTMRMVLAIVCVACFTGCASVIQSQRVLDNVGRSYLAVEPTKQVHITNQIAYVEFSESYYTDHMPLAGEDIHMLWLTRNNKTPLRLVYLKMATPEITGEAVFDRLVSNKTSLVAAKDAPLESTVPVPFPQAFRTRMYNTQFHFQFEGYPVVLEEHRDATWYLVAPVQVPAFVVDYGLTVAMIPIGLVAMIVR